MSCSIVARLPLLLWGGMIVHRGWARELAAAGFVFASAPGRAAAQIDGPGFVWDVGVYIGYHFGGAAPRRFSVGLEWRGIYGERSPACLGDRFSPYGGAVARAGLVGRAPRFVAAFQGGLRGSVLGAGGEVGVGFDLAQMEGPFVQPGLEASFGQMLTLRAHHAFARDTALSFGVRGGTASDPGCVILDDRPVIR